MNYITVAIQEGDCVRKTDKKKNQKTLIKCEVSF